MFPAPFCRPAAPRRPFDDQRIQLVPLLACLLLLATVLLATTTTASARETRRHYLSGTGVDDAVAWDFFCTEGLRSGEWTTIPVPSQWDALGFGALAYGHRPDASEKKPVEHGKYRTRFRTPADWSGHAVFLVFEGSMTDTQAWVNGQSAGPLHQGGFYRFRYDVTALLKSPGEENLLEVDVAKDSADASINRAERQGDYWNFGGIFRPVYLEARPARHIDRVAIDARADGAFAIDVFTAGAPAADSLRAQILDLAGRPVGSPFTRPLAAAKTRLDIKIDSPRTWTAETPELYQVEVSLLAGEQTLHRLRQRFGFRTLEVRPGAGLFVNGQRVLLKGTNRHTFHPEHGRASSARLSREDILLMKEMNNNAVRMSHYPPDEHFLDLCDEIGLYVLDEIAGWQKSYDEAPGRRIVEQTVTRDVNHPSILFWDNGNEGGWNTAIDDDFARWDPQQRPVLHPWAPFRGIDTKHYPRWDLHLQKAKGPDLYMPTEFLHALFDGGGGASLKDYWEVIRTSPVGAGGFIWAFVDECMKRPDRDGPLDGRGNLAPDGILGPYREKEASFYTVKELWSPIVATRDADGAITIENRHDFTDASRCVFTWQLRRFASPSAASSAPHRVVAEGRVAVPSIAPHASAVLPLELPADAASSADALALRVDDPSGRELWTWVWPLRSTPATTPTTSASAVTASEDAATITLRAGDFSATFAKTDARLLSARRGAAEFPLRHGPRLAIGDAALATITHRADGADHLVTATFSGNLKSIEWRLRPDGALLLDTAYALDTPCDYFGLSFDLPESEVRGMRWLGDGPFRVWKNRRQGVSLGVWENAINHTATGYIVGLPRVQGLLRQCALADTPHRRRPDHGRPRRSLSLRAGAPPRLPRFAEAAQPDHPRAQDHPAALHAERQRLGQRPRRGLFVAPRHRPHRHQIRSPLPTRPRGPAKPPERHLPHPRHLPLRRRKLIRPGALPVPPPVWARWMGGALRPWFDFPAARHRFPTRPDTAACHEEAKRFLFVTVPTLVIKSVPAKLHARLKRTAAAHRRSLTQETIHLLEKALAAEEAAAAPAPRSGPSYWATRPLQPAYAAALAAGAFAAGTDSGAALSTERDEQ